MIALFGDSIANGMGGRGKKYGQLVAHQMGLELADFSATARQVDESLELLVKSDVSPTVALIAHGVTESIVRPQSSSLRWLPPRWRRLGWMDPRPYYSTRLRKRLPERLESAIRWRVKSALIRFGPTHQLMDLGVFSRTLAQLCDELTSRGARVILLGPLPLESRYFPQSQAALAAVEETLRGLAEVRGDTFVPLRGEVELWDDFALDRFRPNDGGHEKIAAAVRARLQERTLHDRG